MTNATIESNDAQEVRTPWTYTIWAIGPDVVNSPFRLTSGHADNLLKAGYATFQYIKVVTPPSDYVRQEQRIVHSDPNWYEMVETYLNGYMYEVRYEADEPADFV